MSRISTPAVAAATGATAELFSRIKKMAGSVPNTFAAIGSLQPAALGAMLDAEAVLAAGSLSKQDVETVKLIVSAATGCDYCVAAHSLLGKLAGLRPDAIRKIRAGEPTGDGKRDALAILVRTLVATSGTISDERNPAASDESRSGLGGRVRRSGICNGVRLAMASPSAVTVSPTLRSRTSLTVASSQPTAST